ARRRRISAARRPRITARVWRRSSRSASRASRVGSPVHIRQVALVARDLEPVVADLRAVLGLSAGFVDPGVGAFGLRNEVLAVGTTFLEVVSPVEESTTAGRFLARRGGDGGYMVILQTDDLAADRRRLAALGVRIVWEASLDDVATVHLHPRDVGGAIVSLDQPRPPASWRCGGPRWGTKARTDVVRGVPSPPVAAAGPGRWAARGWQGPGRGPPRPAGRTLELRLAPGALRFVQADARGEGGVAVGLDATDADRGLATARARALPVEGRSV